MPNLMGVFVRYPARFEPPYTSSSVRLRLLASYPSLMKGQTTNHFFLGATMEIEDQSTDMMITGPRLRHLGPLIGRVKVTLTFSSRQARLAQAFLAMTRITGFVAFSRNGMGTCLIESHPLNVTISCLVPNGMRK
jgi:hypothetical protein